MSFVPQLPNRPSCIVAALPKRYRESLERDLAGSVTISTCSIEELESTVQMRRATMAVVGVNGGSLNIAERLSHNDRNLKVFLAHYRETGKASTNGFAGVFDLRFDPKLLAETIRQTVSQHTHSVSHEPIYHRTQRPQLSRFLEMQSRLSNKPALFDSILCNILQLAEAGEGVLAVPEAQTDRFEIVASFGDEPSALGRQLTLDPACFDNLHDRAFSVIDPSDIQFDPGTLFMESTYRAVLPITNHGKLYACVLADFSRKSDDLCELLEGAGVILEKSKRNEVKAGREKLILDARDVISSGWIIADDQGRVLHQEGRGGMWISQHKSRIMEPRLRDLIHQIFAGNKSTAKIRGRTIRGHSLLTDTGHYCILETDNSTHATIVLPGAESVLVRAILRQAIKSSSIDLSLFDLLTNSMEKCGISVPVVELKGLNLKPAWSDVPDNLVPALGLIILVAKAILQGGHFTASFERSGSKWFLTLEVPEAQIQVVIPRWKEEPSLLAVVQFVGLNAESLRFGLFGFQLSGKITTTGITEETDGTPEVSSLR